MPQVKQTTQTRQQLLHRLEEFNAVPPVLSIYIKRSAKGPEIEKMLVSVLDRGELLDGLITKAAKSTTGAVIFYTMGRACLIWPPFPVVENAIIRGYDYRQIKKMLEHSWRLGLVMVRLGHYAIGVVEGEKLIAAKAGTGLVHARHHKGGSSAHRFERHRDKQIEYFFTRIEVHAREILEPQIKEIDYVFYGGTRATLQTLWKQCRFFGTLQNKVVDRLLSVREPRRSSFEEAVGLVYMSTMFEIKE